MSSIVAAVLQHYRLPPLTSVEFLGGAGGFSGAQIWKLTSATQSFCLRRWPAGQPTPERLEWINLVLVHAGLLGCEAIPVPLETSHSSRRFVSQFESLWELTPWMPGTADFRQHPGDAKLTSAVTCLARFHLASAQVSLEFGPSPSVRARYRQLLELPSLFRRLATFDRRQATEMPPAIELLRRRMLEIGAERAGLAAQRLEPFTNTSLPLQPVIRDVWHDHLLFTNDDITGLVDFGAMQIDSVGVDLARMLGSLLGDNVERWRLGLDEYSRIRMLQPRERQLAEALDQAAVVLGSANWLNWTLLESRTFESWPDVELRVQELLQRLA